MAGTPPRRLSKEEREGLKRLIQERAPAYYERVERREKILDELAGLPPRDVFSVDKKGNHYFKKRKRRDEET